jgi:hypothetical protein
MIGFGPYPGSHPAGAGMNRIQGVLSVANLGWEGPATRAAAHPDRSDRSSGRWERRA